MDQPTCTNLDHDFVSFEELLSIFHGEQIYLDLEKIYQEEQSPKEGLEDMDDGTQSNIYQGKLEVRIATNHSEETEKNLL